MTELTTFMYNMINNIWIPVVTAIVTTLIIEYFAKPKLEARKQRIIRDRNHIDEVIFSTQEIGMLCGSLNFEKSNINNDAINYLTEQIKSLFEAIEKFQQLITHFPSKYVARNTKLLSCCMFFRGKINAELIKSKKYIENQQISNLYESLDRVQSLSDDLHTYSYLFEFSRSNIIKRLLNHPNRNRENLKIEKQYKRINS